MSRAFGSDDFTYRLNDNRGHPPPGKPLGDVADVGMHRQDRAYSFVGEMSYTAWPILYPDRRTAKRICSPQKNQEGRGMSSASVSRPHRRR
jgi:hypothetical protein